MFTIEVQNAAGKTLARAEGMGDARLIYEGSYGEGDRLVFAAAEKYLRVRVDQAVEAALVYVPSQSFSFAIPFGDAKNGYAPQAFAGEKHAATIEAVPEEVFFARRNVALNPIDQHEASGCYPHASANVETRGEAQFWARNAIDGHRFNEKHGGWPYHSWGIGERCDAWLRIDFGRVVTIDEVAVVLRAHFPHDAWWERGAIECSDGFTIELPLHKTAEVQRFALGEHAVEWIILRDLVKADDPSPFPALTQMEIYGR